jgi:hypothetical protein
MPITPKENIVIPETVLDKYWLKEVRIMAPEVGGEARAEVVLVPYNSNGDKDYSRIKVINFENIMASIAAGDTNLENALDAILLAVQAKENA